MNENDLNNLYSLLDALIKCAPCNGGACVGYQNCEFGENGCYGESCAIQDVISASEIYANCNN